MPSSTIAESYLLTTLEFDVGSQHVKFYGAIKITTGKDLYFILSDKMQFDPKLLPAAEVTESIANPFEMNGVELTKLDASAHIYKDAGDKTQINLTLEAAASFLNLKNFDLYGAIVFESQTPRLALVELSANQPLTLTDFIQFVIGGIWDGIGVVTNQFAFLEGHMYYLSGEANYTFNYTDGNGKSQSLQCAQGYHLAATLRIFQKYDFLISLDVVENDAIVLTTTALQKFDFDFITLNNLDFRVSTKSGEKYVRFHTNATILQTPITTDIIAEYHFDSKMFCGEVSVDLGSVSIPTLSGSNDVDVNLDVGFSWTEQTASGGGFSVTKIEGLPLNTLDLIEKLLGYLNDLRGCGCEKILGDWLKNLSKTVLTPALNGSPYKRDDGRMNLPLKLTYEIKAGDMTIASSEIDFAAVLDVPSSLSDLPRAMWDTIIFSIGDIVADMLQDKGTYEAIALEAAKQGGSKALARFICRSLNNPDAPPDSAEDLANEADAFPPETLADAAELAGALMAVSLLGVSFVLALFEKAWDAIKHAFTGGKTEKEKAEDQIYEIWDKVKSSVADVDSRIADIKNTIKIVALTTDLTEQNQFEAQIVWQRDVKDKLDAGSALSCSFEMLTGAAGDVAGQILPGTLSEKQLFPVYKNWSAIPSNENYRLNAGVQSVLTGFTFMNNATRDSLSGAISTLRGFSDDVADNFADYLQSKLDEYQSYNDHGVKSEWVYAQSDFPSQMTVGKSHIGINTRI
jgi:hypothetical protein